MFGQVQRHCSAIEFQNLKISWAPSIEASEPTQSAGGTIRQFDGGSISDATIKAGGIVVGVVVAKAEGENWKITEVMKNSVKLSPLAEEGGKKKAKGVVVSFASLLDEWTVKKIIENVSIDFAEASVANDALLHQNVKIDFEKPLIRLALVKLYSQHKADKKLGGIKIDVKPRLQVVAKQTFRPGQIVLVPLSTNVLHTFTTVPSTSVNLGTRDAEGLPDDCKFYLPNTFAAESKCGKKKFAVPFWAVRRTPDTAAANMDLPMQESTVQVAALGKSGEKFVASLPVLANTVTIHADDELTISEQLSLGAPGADNKKTKKSQQAEDNKKQRV